jgi:hypothetical protein
VNTLLVLRHGIFYNGYTNGGKTEITKLFNTCSIGNFPQNQAFQQRQFDELLAELDDSREYMRKLTTDCADRLVPIGFDVVTMPPG